MFWLQDKGPRAWVECDAVNTVCTLGKSRGSHCSRILLQLVSAHFLSVLKAASDFIPGTVAILSGQFSVGRGLVVKVLASSSTHIPTSTSNHGDGEAGRGIQGHIFVGAEQGTETSFTLRDARGWSTKEVVHNGGGPQKRNQSDSLKAHS